MKSEIKIEAVAADSDRFVFKVLGFQLACYIVMWNEAYRLLHVMCSKILGFKTPNIKGSPRQNFFLSAGHPLTVRNGVILCPKNDAIKKIWVYIDFMCRRLDFWRSKLILHMIIHWKIFFELKWLVMHLFIFFWNFSCFYYLLRKWFNVKNAENT